MRSREVADVVRAVSQHPPRLRLPLGLRLRRRRYLALALALVLVLVLVLGACSQPAPHRDDRRALDRPLADARAPDDGLASNNAEADAPHGAARDGLHDAALTPRVDAPGVTIIDAPMAWSAERERLTLDYRRAHSDASAIDLTIEPRVIVLHYTGGGSATATRTYFDNTRIEAARKALARGGAVNVSAHFIVDRDGTIYRLQPETRFARHCIGLNHVAIGIENVGDGKKYPLTDAQVAANAALVRDLAARFSITHLLGHHEVMQFRAHPYFVELDASYKNSKSDPGAAFMARVRERVADLGLAGL